MTTAMDVVSQAKENAVTFLATTILGAVVFGVFLVWKKWDYMKTVRACPGPLTTFPFGNALQLELDGADFYDQVYEWCRNHWTNGFIPIWFGSFHPMIFVYKPELVEIILSSSRQISKSFEYKFIMHWLGTGLLTSDGDKWRQRRKLITPTFHFKILNDFIQVFEDQAKVLVSILKTDCQKGAVDIFPKITLYTLDIICATSMGKLLHAQKAGNSTYVNAILSMSDLFMTRVKQPWLHVDWIYNLTAQGKQYQKNLKILHGFAYSVIDERISERKSSVKEEEEVDEFTGKRKRHPLAFLDLLLDAYDDGKIDKEGIREEVDTFMFEGHDTTASGISWAIQRLGENPDIQRKAQQEVDAFFESRPESLTVDALKELKYLECVIKESLRLHPSVPAFARNIVEDVKFGDNKIPAGSTVAIAPMSLHRNPYVWPDPDKFDPDRFLPENSEGRHPYAYVPFSAGPRNCIGQKFALLEEKVTLAYLLHHFDIKSEKPWYEARMTVEVISRPKNGIHVTLTPRY